MSRREFEIDSFIASEAIACEVVKINIGSGLRSLLTVQVDPYAVPEGLQPDCEAFTRYVQPLGLIDNPDGQLATVITFDFNKQYGVPYDSEH